MVKILFVCHGDVCQNNVVARNSEKTVCRRIAVLTRLNCLLKISICINLVAAAVNYNITVIGSSSARAAGARAAAITAAASSAVTLTRRLFSFMQFTFPVKIRFSMKKEEPHCQNQESLLLYIAVAIL